MSKKVDPLDKIVIDGIHELFDPKSKKTPDERSELRENIKLVMGWKKIAGDESWGSGFGGKKDDDGSDD